MVDKIAKGVARAFAEQDLRDWVAKHGGEPISMTQPEFVRFVQSESQSAGRLIKAADIKPSNWPCNQAVHAGTPLDLRTLRSTIDLEQRYPAATGPTNWRDP